MNTSRQALPYNYMAMDNQHSNALTDGAHLAAILGALTAALVWIWRTAIKDLLCWGWNAFKAPGRIMEFSKQLEQLRNEVHIHGQASNIMLDMLPDPIWKSDSEGNCIFANRVMLRTLGRQFSELAGQNWQQIIASEDADRVIRAWNSAVEEKRDFVLGYEWVHSNGTDYIHVDVNTFRNTDLNGNLVGYTAWCKANKMPRREPI